MKNLAQPLLFVSISSAIFLAACAPTVVKVANDSPNAHVEDNFARCMRAYADLKDTMAGGLAKIQQICQTASTRTAAATKSDLVQLQKDAEVERLRIERERADATTLIREEERREQQAFDSSALGRALNSANRVLEAEIGRRAQASPSQIKPGVSRDSCGPSEPMFVYREHLEEWEARCGRISKQRDPKLPSDPNYRPSQRPSTQIQSPTLPPPVSIADNRTTLPPVRSQADNKDGPGPVVRETYVVSCVHPERVETGGTWRPMAIVNRCPAIKVNVAYCIEGSRGPFRCKGKGFEGSGSADIGQWTPIPDYFTDGGGKIIFGACAAPHYPVDLQGNEFRCSR